MRKPLFHLVRNIVTAEKYFDVSREAIERELARVGKCEVTTDHELVDDSGEPVTASLRLNIHARAEMPTSWAVSLKLHGTRIDGVDFEPKYKMLDGSIANGWHRHSWNPADESAESDKHPITELDGIGQREQFLIRSFKLLRIRVNKSDHGNDFLPFAS